MRKMHLVTTTNIQKEEKQNPAKSARNPPHKYRCPSRARATRKKRLVATTKNIEEQRTNNDTKYKHKEEVRVGPVCEVRNVHKKHINGLAAQLRNANPLVVIEFSCNL